MIAALTLLLPLSFGGAVSPMLLTEQTVLLGTGGRRAANLFALGAALTLLVVVSLLVFLGRAIELPTEPKLSAGLDIVLGLVLIAAGALVLAAGRRASNDPGGEASADHARFSDRPEAAFSFGVFSMATNFTTLALVVVAAKEIAESDVGTLGHIVLILFVVAVCSLPAWLPLAATRLAPATGQRALDALKAFITDHGRTAIVVLLLGAGAFFVCRGLFGL